MYRAPADEIAFVLNHVAPGPEDGPDADLVAAVLGEAGRFAEGEVAPLADVGDQEGAKLADGVVSTPEGWPDLYRRWRGGGWNGLSLPEEWGGQGLPVTLGMAAHEMWNGANMAFGLCPMLTTGAVEALVQHASPELQKKYLPKLVSGEWTGTMNLTEPHAGSDLGGVSTKAREEADGTFRVFGQKIYITFGEHDWTDNIVHLVLARIEGAPQGTKGISLFLVPKFLVEEDGSLGARNDLVCAGIEHKLGIHGSPTCTMVYGNEGRGAVGWLVGERGRGLNAMFTMMNNARLAVGMQGVAVADAAFTKARRFAAERKQGRAAGSDGMAPIIRHPDVQRMLLSMQGLTQAARAICYLCARALDAGEHDPAMRNRAGLLTPIAKAFGTDVGVDVASLGLQVHGGMGFVEETGAARLYRDARIAPIYEGTNGIQAIDLVSRKLPLEDGEHVRGFIAELRDTADAVRASNRPEFGETAERLTEALDALADTTGFLQAAVAEKRDGEWLAGATPYLRLFGLAAGGALLARGALSSGDEKRAALARFFAENLVGETAALAARVKTGAPSLNAASELLLDA